MQKQKQYYNHFLVYERLISSVFKIIDQQKRRIKTLERISLMISLLLTYLIKNNNFSPTRASQTKKTRTTKKVFGAVVDKDRIEAKIFLQQISILLLRKKKKIFSYIKCSFYKKKSHYSNRCPKKKELKNWYQF